MKNKLIAVLMAGMVTGASFATVVETQTGCKDAQQVENAIFTTEQISCMAVGLLSGVLTGTEAEVAGMLQSACGILPTLTNDIIKFVQSFRLSTPMQMEKWKAVAAKYKLEHPDSGV